jgi:TfoX/Sxy family transcriptional regulator of competence genes
MASDQNFVDFVTDQLTCSGLITSRKMFGEYCLYSNGKVVALICDNRLLVKQTDAGRAFIGDVVEASPYPGAKPALLIEDKIEDGEWLSELIDITERALPKPKPKRKKKAKKS